MPRHRIQAVPWITARNFAGRDVMVTVLSAGSKRVAVTLTDSIKSSVVVYPWAAIDELAELVECARSNRPGHHP